MRNNNGMTYQEKRVAMREHLQNASSLLRQIWRLGSAYRDEIETIMYLADNEVDQSKLAKLVSEIAHSEDWLRDDFEITLDKLLRQPKSARARRMWLKD